MALNIDGYNNAFKSFVDFAQNQIDKHRAKAIADEHEEHAHLP